MAAGNSGTFEFSYTEGQYGTHKLRFTWSETITGLTSSVAIKKVEAYTSSYGGFRYYANWILEINGEDVITQTGSGFATLPLNTWREVLFNGSSITGSTTAPIDHEADGTKSVTVKLKKKNSPDVQRPYMYCPGGNLSPDVTVMPFSIVWTNEDSVSIALKKVDTASSFTVTGDTMGSPINIAISRQSSTLKHTLKWSFAGNSGTIDSNVDTSYAWTPNANTFGGYIPSADSGSCTITCETWSGSTKVGETAKTFTLKIPADAAPTAASGWSSIGYDNTGTAASTIAAVVKGYSKLTWALDVSKITLKYGATLASVKAVYGSTTVTKTASGTYTLGTAASTSNTVSILITDSRGKTRSASFSESAYDYAAPGFSGVAAFRTDDQMVRKDDEYISAKATAVFSSLGGANSAAIKFWTKQAGGSYVGSGTTLPDGTLTLLSNAPDFDLTKSYVVRLAVTDALGNSAALEITIPTAAVAFNIMDGGVAAAFGKYAEVEHTLDIGDYSIIGRAKGLGIARRDIPQQTGGAYTDFDDYTEPGVYGVWDSSYVATYLNCPSGKAGILTVTNSHGDEWGPGHNWYSCIQEYDDIDGNRWRRGGVEHPVGTVVWTAWTAQQNVSSFGNSESYCKYPDGTMIQWGTCVVSGSGNMSASPLSGLYRSGFVTVTLPTAFYNTAYTVSGTSRYSTGHILPIAAIPGTTSAFTADCYDFYARSLSDGNLRIYWQAVGRWK